MGNFVTHDTPEMAMTEEDAVRQSQSWRGSRRLQTTEPEEDAKNKKDIPCGHPLDA